MDSSLGNTSRRAVIILAGGEGLRMRSVTRFITGQDDVPKQFCPMMDVWPAWSPSIVPSSS